MKSDLNIINDCQELATVVLDRLHALGALRGHASLTTLLEETSLTSHYAEMVDKQLAELARRYRVRAQDAAKKSARELAGSR